MQLLTLCCADAGFSQCDWQVNAGADQLLLMMFEDHMLAEHNLIIGARARNAIRDSIKSVQDNAHPAELAIEKAP